MQRYPIRKPVFILMLCLASMLLLAGVFAYPWSGMSYIEHWREMRSGRIYYSAKTKDKVVALTFDDGPDPRYTGQVLNILKEHKVRATFFVCGKMLKANPELAKRILAEGHALGNHTDTHPHLERMGNPGARLELETCESQIEAITGQRTYMFRPPRGLWNSAVFDDARRSGYSIILWSLAFDRQAVKDSSVLRRRVVRLAKAGDIILMHDGSTDPQADIRKPTVRELDAMITGLEQRGFSFSTVPDLLHIRGNRMVHAQPKPPLSPVL
jgi:peptidoglycan/xylan/chitin deacetylase (PgdA/CDA1 family)